MSGNYYKRLKEKQEDYWRRKRCHDDAYDDWRKGRRDDSHDDWGKECHEDSRDDWGKECHEDSHDDWGKECCDDSHDDWGKECCDDSHDDWGKECCDDSHDDWGKECHEDSRDDWGKECYEDSHDDRRKGRRDDSHDNRRKERHEKKDKSKSAFLATNFNAVPIPVPLTDTIVKFLFPIEEFDLQNEYNPVTSTFVAREAGVYSFTSAVEFAPRNPNIDYAVVLQFAINGVIQGGEIDYTESKVLYRNVVEVNDTFRLNAGDRVEVFARSSTLGVITATRATRFSGVREQ